MIWTFQFDSAINSLLCNMGFDGSPDRKKGQNMVVGGAPPDTVLRSLIGIIGGELRRSGG